MFPRIERVGSINFNGCIVHSLLEDALYSKAQFNLFDDGAAQPCTCNIVNFKNVEVFRAKNKENKRQKLGTVYR